MPPGFATVASTPLVAVLVREIKNGILDAALLHVSPSKNMAAEVYDETLEMLERDKDTYTHQSIGYVAENSAARRKLKSQGHWFLDECAFLEFLELAILECNPQKSDDNSSGSGKPWNNPAHIVMGLRSETPLEDPTNRSTWKRDRRM
ncbi:MAG: hypothetical protein Q9196_005719 [Gyalolechia fulgens]